MEKICSVLRVSETGYMSQVFFSLSLSLSPLFFGVNTCTLVMAMSRGVDIGEDVRHTAGQLVAVRNVGRRTYVTILIGGSECVWQIGFRTDQRA